MKINNKLNLVKVHDRETEYKKMRSEKGNYIQYRLIVLS